MAEGSDSHATTPATQTPIPSFGSLRDRADRLGVGPFTGPWWMEGELKRAMRDFRGLDCEAMTITGRVVLQGSGEGVADVKVSLSRYSQALDFDDPAKTAITDENGLFVKVLEGIPKDFTSISYQIQPPAGYLRPSVQFRTPGRNPYSVSVADCAGEVTIELLPTAILRGRVLEPDGVTPAVGANLEIFTSQNNHRYLFYGNQITSDAAGRFEISSPPHDIVRLSTSHELGHASASVTAPGIGERSAEVEIVLVAEAAVRGRVMTPDGAPMEGVRLYSSARVPTVSGYTTSSEGSETSDENGEFFLEDLPAGRLIEIGVRQSDLRGTASLTALAPPEPIQLTLEPREVREGIELRFQEGDIIRGVVLDALTDEPLAGAYVTIGPSTTSTDTEGQFEVGGLTPGQTWEAFVRTDGYESLRQENITFLGGPVTLRMEPRREFHLTVVDSEGRAIERFFCKRADTRWSGAFVQSEGPYPIPLSPALTALTVSVQKVNDQNVPIGPLVKKTFDLTAMPEWRGEIVIDDSQPLQMGRIQGHVIANEAIWPTDAVGVVGAEVFFIADSSKFLEPQTRDPGFNPPPAITGPEGEYAFEDVPVGTHYLMARKDGRETLSYLAVVVAEGETATPQWLILGEAAVLFGQVILPGGSPLADSHLSLWLSYGGSYSPRPPNRTTRTDAQGRFRFDNLAAPSHGRLEIIDDRIPNNQVRFSLELGEEKELDLDFSGGVTVSGRVQFTGDSDYRPRNFSFDSQDSKTDSRKVDLKRDGSFKTELRPGTYDVHFRDEAFGQSHSVHTFQIRDGEPQTELNLEVGYFDAIALLLPPPGGETPGGTTQFQFLDQGTWYCQRKVCDFAPGSTVMAFPGQVSGVVMRIRHPTDPDRSGRAYLASEWLDVGPDRENALILDFGSEPVTHQDLEESLSQRRAAQ
ncbi:MAG: carboxypeptidase-like regulatory domain-containing protein [Sumerlaeia bacterium]